MIRVRLACVLVIGLALTSCKPVAEAINDIFYKGTLAGAEKCMELKASTLVSAENVKATCVAAFEKQVSDSVADVITGTGNPTLSWGRKVFAAQLDNANTDWVITEIKIEVAVLNAEKKVDRRYYATKRVWIEPGQKKFQLTSEEVALAPENWDEIGNCKGCWQWVIAEAKGLEM